MVKKLSSEDVSWVDFLEYGGGTLAQLTTGVPVKSIINSGKGLYNITQGETAKGLLRTVGYTENRADDILGN
jgi:hypothetical protein